MRTKTPEIPEIPEIPENRRVVFANKSLDIQLEAGDIYLWHDDTYTWVVQITNQRLRIYCADSSIDFEEDYAMFQTHKNKLKYFYDAEERSLYRESVIKQFEEVSWEDGDLDGEPCKNYTFTSRPIDIDLEDGDLDGEPCQNYTFTPFPIIVNDPNRIRDTVYIECSSWNGHNFFYKTTIVLYFPKGFVNLHDDATHKWTIYVCDQRLRICNTHSSINIEQDHIKIQTPNNKWEYYLNAEQRDYCRESVIRQLNDIDKCDAYMDGYLCTKYTPAASP